MALLRSCKSLFPLCLEAQSSIALHQRGMSNSSSSTQNSVPVAQPQPAAGKQRAEEEWTEVIDEKTGQTYYWNQKTGETTELGEPRPTTRFRDREWEQAAGSGPFQDGWQEPVGSDHTYFYSFAGMGIGIFVGWAMQFMH